MLADGKGGEHGKYLASRNHYRLAYGSPEISGESELSLVERMKEKLGHLIVACEESNKNWYNTGQPDIPVISDVDRDTVLPLSKFSHVVLNMKPINQVLLYVRPEQTETANKIVREVLQDERNRQGSLGFTAGPS